MQSSAADANSLLMHGPLAADANRLASNEEQTAHLQSGLLHVVRPQIPTAQQGSIQVAWRHWPTYFLSSLPAVGLTCSKHL